MYLRQLYRFELEHLSAYRHAVLRLLCVFNLQSFVFADEYVDSVDSVPQQGSFSTLRDFPPLIFANDTRVDKSTSSIAHVVRR